MSTLEFKVGDEIGLWKILEPPTLSSKGKVTIHSSTVKCLCKGCGNTFPRVRIRYLQEGKSNGCHHCRTSEVATRLHSEMRHKLGRKPSDSNPVCPSCNTVTSTYNKDHGITRYKCRTCGYRTSVKGE